MHFTRVTDTRVHLGSSATKPVQYTGFPFPAKITQRIRPILNCSLLDKWLTCGALTATACVWFPVKGIIPGGVHKPIHVGLHQEGHDTFARIKICVWVIRCGDPEREQPKEENTLTDIKKYDIDIKYEDLREA